MSVGKGTQVLFATMLLMIAWISCSVPNESHPLPDKLVVGTIYSPTSFFIMRGDTLGYDYDRICDFARTKNIGLEFKVAPNLNKLIEMLSKGEVDILATEVPNNEEYRKQVINCGSINETQPVLVQHSGSNIISNVTDLAGKDIYVEAHTKYETLVNNLNSELSGAINVHTFPLDSVSTDDLLDMVSMHKIPFTVVDSDIANFNAAYYDSLDVSLTMGGIQTSSWAVSPNNKWLADSIDAWSNSNDARTYSKAALEKYAKKSRIGENDRSNEIPHIGSVPNHSFSSSSGPSRIPQSPSSYDDLFRKYGGGTGWDWHLLSAIARVESGFNPNAQSWAGARGLMQVMPSTARGYGVSADMLFDPETNVRVASRCLHDINKTFLSRVTNRDERLKFVLAAYNAGAGHVLDAIALAEKHGKDPHVWYGNVEEAMLWKSNPQYYNDPICRYGYCRGREPVNYVRSVLRGSHK